MTHIDNPDARHLHRSQFKDVQLAGMVVATKQRRRRRARTYTRASDCISYTREDKSDATVFNAKRTRNNNTTRATATPAPVDHRPEVLRFTNLPTFDLTGD